MYIAKRTNQAGVQYLYIQTPLVVDNKSSIITVERLGRLDKYLAEHGDDALDVLQRRIDNGEFDHLLPKVFSRDIYQERVKKVHSIPEAYDALSKTSTFIPDLNYGCFYINHIFDTELNLSARLSTWRAKEHKFSHLPVAPAFRFMVTRRLLEPKSKLADCKRKNNILGSSYEDLKLHQIFRTLDFAAQIKDKMFKYLHGKLKPHTDMTMVLYDATNFYYESPFTDSEYLNIRTVRHLRKLGLAQDNNYIDFDAPSVKAAIDEFLANYHVGEEGLAERGLNKQKRTDLPQVLVTLLCDRNGMPVDFEVYQGNTSEYSTLKTAIDKLASTYNITGKQLVAAGRGLNSRENILAIKNDGPDVLMSQKISSLSLECMDVNLSDYCSEDDEDAQNDLRPRLKGLDVLSTAEAVAAADDWDKVVSIHDGHSYKIIHKEKIIPYDLIEEVPLASVNDKSLIIEGSVRIKRNKAKTEVCKVLIKTNLVITWSKSRHDVDMAALSRQICKASAFIESKSSLDNNAGFKQLINVRVLDKNGNLVATTPSLAKKQDGNKIVLDLKRDLIKRRRLMSGLYAYVCSDLEMDASEICRQYKNLCHVEESFRLLKNQLALRPAFVKTPSRIKGHVAMCLVALIILRRMHQMSKESGINLSFDEIIEALNQCTVIPAVDTGSDTIHFVRTGRIITDDDYIYGKDLAMLLAKSMGFETIIGKVNKTVLGRKLKTKFFDVDRMLGKNYIERLRAFQPEPVVPEGGEEAAPC